MTFKTLVPLLALLSNLFLLSGWALAQNGVYTMQDLEALEGTESFDEFFSHAKDIRPSQRGQVWERMVSSMADRYLQSLQSSLAITEEQFAKAAEISGWNILKEDEFFANKRHTFALKYLQQCLDRQPASETAFKTCRQRLLNFFLAFDKEREFGVAIADVLKNRGKFLESRHGGEQWNIQEDLELWSFVAPMAASPFGKFYCHKDPLYSLLLSRSSLPRPLENELHQDCIDAFTSKARESLGNPRGKMAQQAYAALDRFQKLKPAEKAKRQVVLLLEGAERLQASSKNPQDLGQGLEALRLLGPNLELRKELYQELVLNSPLPDSLFRLPKNSAAMPNKNVKRQLVLIKQLAKNFPEYLDYYTGQCLSWLAGEESFPQGNPTPYCHDYFVAAQIVGSSPEPVIKKYHQIMNAWKSDKDREN